MAVVILYTFEKRCCDFDLSTRFVCLSSRLWRDGLTSQDGVKWGQYHLQELENATLVKMIRFRFIWTITSHGQNHILAYNFKSYERIHTKFYLYRAWDTPYIMSQVSDP